MPDLSSRRRPITAPVHGSSEYSQAYSYNSLEHRPRPRHPISTWTARNRSNILPSEPERRRPSSANQRARDRRQARRWPWQERGARSGIFENPTAPDVNNNPTVPIPVNQPLGRRHWQQRANVSSAILYFNRPDRPETVQLQMPPPVRHQPKWPWQQRAMQSTIFDQPAEEQHSAHKTYQWDQRKSSHFNEPQPSTSEPKRTQKSWPWQDKARESNIFTASANKVRQRIEYPWDQRQSGFDVKDDSTVKFENVSRYQQDFKNKKNEVHTLEAAGKRCYTTAREQRKSMNPTRSEPDIVGGQPIKQSPRPAGQSSSRHESTPRKPYSIIATLQNENELTEGISEMNVATSSIKQENPVRIANITVEQQNCPNNNNCAQTDNVIDLTHQ